MKLLRTFVAPVAALAIAASPAFGQFDQNKTSSSDVAFWVNTHLHAPIQMTQAPGQPILDAFCIDYQNSVHVNPTPVNLTRLDASATDFNNNTRFGYAKLDSYMKAAWLVQFFSPVYNVDPVVTRDFQYTLWHLFTNQPTPGRPGEAYFQGLLATNQWQTINPKYWFIISDDAMTPGTTRSGFPRVGGNQEYLTMVAPEPSAVILLGTGMLGIVGLAARRRKKQ